MFPKTAFGGRRRCGTFALAAICFTREIVQGIFDERIFDEHGSLKKQSPFRARGSQSCRIRGGGRRLWFAVDADCRSRSVESSPRPDRGGALRHHECRRASRRSEGDANNAQAGTRTGRPWSEAGATGEPSDTIDLAFVSSWRPSPYPVRDADFVRHSRSRKFLCARSRQRTLTNAAHMAASMAPAKT